MSEIDAKVNMSLDDIIKMDKKDKKKKAVAGRRTGGNVRSGGKGGAKRNRAGKGPRGNQRGVSVQGRVAKAAKANVALPKKRRAQQQQKQQRQHQEQQNAVRKGFVTKRYNKNNPKKNNRAGGLVRSRSNTALNRLKNNNNVIGNNILRGAFAARRGNAGKFGLTRSKSRTNLISPTMKRFFTNNKRALKRTHSLPNLRDPTSVHNRLGYQSPAQVAYRNRVKRAKQLLLQRQSQRMQIPNNYRVPRNGKAMSNLQQRALVERRQRILTPQRNFNSVGLRSDQILRAQRRAQYAQKLMRMNALRMNPNPNVNFMCTLGYDYAPGVRQRSLSMAQPQSRGLINPRQLSRARSPFRPNPQPPLQLGPAPLFVRQPRSRSRSRSRSRTRNAPIAQSGASVDDRSFSQMMYSLAGNLGVTERTLNDRFSF